ncbi:sigma-70 family RNA polymerase sigma factor [Hamadaea tsunoensis]|uniref:sigma-70 family RNA polymerase sigma factor n=1 Tax=Hamadaea tsunoensis TaxID=53368 RepID=UPI0003F8FA13|nr:sigma-70 family RNA polymerase sigma factor [Hamadaea tsunoensis]
MTVQIHSALTSDAELLTRVRDGDSEAYGELYRRHVDAARRLAVVLAHDRGEAEDLAADAFARVLASLRSGGGPRTAFRPYLLTSVRNAFYDRVRRAQRVEPTDAIEDYETPEPYEDPSIAALERSYAARAFARLPERWRAVLWHTEVEGESPTQIAPLFGLTANAVSVLAYRARERLRQGYLAEHITVTGSPRCHWTGEHLPGYVRAGLPGRERTKVEDHLGECAECRRLHRELTEANVSLRVVLAPLLLGSAAPGYLATAGGRAGLAAALTGLLAGGWHGLAAVCGRWVEGVRTAWWWVSTLPRRLARRYGGANVAAAGGLIVAAMLGITMFVVTVLAHTGTPGSRHTDAAPLPIPAPAVGPGSTPTAPAAAPSSPAAASGAGSHRATGASPSAASIRPATAPGTVAVTPDTSGSELVAGGRGVLPIAFSRTEESGREESARTPAPTPVALAVAPAPAVAPAVAPAPDPSTILRECPRNCPTSPDSPEHSRKIVEKPGVEKPGGGKEGKGWVVSVTLPEGITLADADAGDGWSCANDKTDKTGTRIGCARTRTAAGSVARIPVEIGKNVTGFQQVTLKIDGRVTSFRVPVAPAGARVAFAAAGRLRTTVAGNTLVSCVPRPVCLSQDNNDVQVGPLLPTDVEPGVPAGLVLPGPRAASGALLDLPATARIRWAGLIVAGSNAASPDAVQLHDGHGWHQVELTSHIATSGAAEGTRRVRQGFADVTALLRAGHGPAWWVAAPAGRLPAGLGAFAGWSLAVVYELPTLPVAEVAVHLGPLALQTPLTVRTSRHSLIDVAYAMWDGDKGYAGDTLRIGGTAVGVPGNFAQGFNPSAAALECAGRPRCDGRTPGVDLGVVQARTSGTGGVTVDPGDDPLGWGLLAVGEQRAR